MDSLVQWFTANLSGVISKEAIIFIISMIPILELRGGLLAASPALLNVPILRAIPICIVGNILPIPFILLLIRHVLEWMKKVPCFRGIALWLERKAMSKKGRSRNMSSGADALCRHPASGNRRMDRRAGGIPAPHEIWQGIWRDFSRYRAGDGDYVDSVLRRAGRAVWMMRR